MLESKARDSDDEMVLGMNECIVDEVEEVLAQWQGANIQHEHLNDSIEVKLRLGLRAETTYTEVDVVKDDLSQTDLDVLPYAFEGYQEYISHIAALCQRSAKKSKPIYTTTEGRDKQVDEYQSETLNMVKHSQ